MIRQQVRGTRRPTHRVDPAFRSIRRNPGDLALRTVDAEEGLRILSGGVILSSEHGAIALAPSGQPFDAALGSFTLVSGGEPLRVRTEPMVHGAKTYYIQVAISGRLAALTRSLIANLLARDTVRFALASIVLFTVAVYSTLRRVLMPLRDTSAAAARIDAQNISKRLSTRKLPIAF